MKEVKISPTEESITEIVPSKEFEQVSSQLNNQDMDQVQFNTQNINFSVRDQSLGKIIGVVYAEKNKILLNQIQVSLYFGDVSKTPIKETKSKDNGYFEFTELPPGFYTVVARINTTNYPFQYLKVTIGDIVFLSIPLITNQ